MSRCHIAAAVLTAILLFAASPLQAQEGPTPPLRLTQDQQEQWYGWQVLALDVAAVAAVAYGAAQKEPLLLSTGIAAYALTGPSVHLAHGNSAKAGTSLVLRVVTPAVLGLVGGLISSAASASNDGNNLLLYAAPGAVLGGLVAIVIDNTTVADVDRRSWLAPAPRAW